MEKSNEKQSLGLMGRSYMYNALQQQSKQIIHFQWETRFPMTWAMCLTRVCLITWQSLSLCKWAVLSCGTPVWCFVICLCQRIGKMILIYVLIIIFMLRFIMHCCSIYKNTFHSMWYFCLIIMLNCLIPGEKQFIIQMQCYFYIIYLLLLYLFIL